MRERIDVSEIEAKTKIRAKYLRALENEEWGLLPGPTFVKSFLRTYADALDLDGKALVEEYRLHHERPSDAMLEPIVSTPQSRRTRGSDSGPSRGYVIAVSAIGVVIVALIVLLVAGGGSSKNAGGTSSDASTHTGASSARHATGAATAHRRVAPSQIVALSLKPTAVVYVCLIDANGRKVIPGLELQPGKGTPTYHSRRFEIRLGNSSVTMFVDGRARTVAPSSQPIGYSLTKANGRQVLPAGRLPSCT
jgi:cytoskeleton protein RodZ